jgi:hypothetical protein
VPPLRPPLNPNRARLPPASNRFQAILVRSGSPEAPIYFGWERSLPPPKALRLGQGEESFNAKGTRLAPTLNNFYPGFHFTNARMKSYPRCEWHDSQEKEERSGSRAHDLMGLGYLETIESRDPVVEQDRHAIEAIADNRDAIDRSKITSHSEEKRQNAKQFSGLAQGALWLVHKSGGAFSLASKRRIDFVRSPAV